MVDERSVSSLEVQLHAEEIERHSFSAARKGLDPNEVRAYLFELAREVRTNERRNAELIARLADAERRAASIDDLDDTDILRRFGEQTAHLLSDAHQTAAGIRDQARRDAESIAAEVEAEILEVRGATEAKVEATLNEAEAERSRRLYDADYTIDGRIADTERRCADLRRAAEVDAERYAQATLERCRELVFEAQGARERLLRDLARRSRIATAQIEQLRAGRERLLESYRNVRRSFDDVTHDLQRADSEARAASDAVATRLDGILEASPTSLISELGLITDTSVPDDIDSVLRSWTNDDGYASTMFDGSSALASITDISSLLPGGVGDGPHLHVLHNSQAGFETSEADDEADENLPFVVVAIDANESETATNEVVIVAEIVAQQADDYSDQDFDDVGPNADVAENDIASIVFIVDADVADVAGEASLPVGPASIPEPPVLTSLSRHDRHQVEKQTKERDKAAKESNKPSVDSLFARLRADREAAAESAAKTMKSSNPTATAVPASILSLDDTKSNENDVDVRDEMPLPTNTDINLTQEDDHHDSAESPMSPAPDMQSPPPIRRAPRVNTGGVATKMRPGIAKFVSERDDVTTPLSDRLARALKRTLQDEQNDLLDRLRAKRMKSSVVSVPVLSDIEVHSAPYRNAAIKILAEAASAGVNFASGSHQPQIGTSVEVDALANGLANAVATTLRHRLGDVLSAASAQPNIDERELSEQLSGAYREWKLNRIDTAASDAVLDAFAKGSYAATAPDTVVTWVVDADHSPCSDCDDNALDGPQAIGNAFPTGVVAPMVHSGCRCLLVREDLL